MWCYLVLEKCTYCFENVKGDLRNTPKRLIGTIRHVLDRLGLAGNIITVRHILDRLALTGNIIT